MYPQLRFFILISILSSCTIKVNENRAFWPVKTGELKDYKNLQEVNIILNDSNYINSVYYNHPDSKKVILFFHGNSKNLWAKFNRIAYARDAKIDFFMIDYPGYGKTPGKPSFKSVFLHAEKSYEYLLKKYKKEDIVLMGTSLGSLPAAKMASEGKGAKLILESAITSVDDMLEWVYSQSIFIRLFVSFELDSKIKFDQYKIVGSITCPVLFIHPEKDMLSPIENAKKLYEKTKSQHKFFYSVKDAGHNEPFKHEKEYVKELEKFIHH